jgi:hypothetical protein
MDTNKLVLQAIAMRTCIEATYNREEVKLAPHILYTRHDELYVDAVTVERRGLPPRETKLGTFKLAGLAVSGLAPRSFEPYAVFDPEDGKFEGVTLFAVEA